MDELRLLLICNALKGSATKVLTAFLMAGTALDIDGLIKWTRMERHSIDAGLKQLRDYGLVMRQVLAHNRAIWMLANNVFPAMRRISDLGNDNETLQFEGFPQTGDLIIINDSTYLSESVNNNNKGQNEGFPHSGDSMTSGRCAEQINSLAKAFSDFKIVGKKKDELLSKDWMTAEYVQASVEFAQAEGHGQFAIGIAITRMIDHLEQPTRRTNGHIENCNCAKCQVDDTLGKYMVCPNCNTYPCQCDDDAERENQ